MKVRLGLAALIGSALALSPGVAAASCPSVTATASPRERGPMMVDPSSGPAPLAVELRWWTFPVADVARVEIDPLGEGRAEASYRSFEASAHTSYTYTREGRYAFTARVRGRDGREHTFSVPIAVLSSSDFERDLQARWSTFRDRVRRGDVSGALECVVSTSRARYERVLNALAPDFHGAADDLRAIQFVERDRGVAVYEMIRPRQGTPYSFDIRFAVDHDGVWRIESL